MRMASWLWTMSDTLWTFCERRHIEFTRSRPYHKNDQAWVEQKNGAVVRRMVFSIRLVSQQRVQFSSRNKPRLIYQPCVSLPPPPSFGVIVVSFGFATYVMQRTDDFHEGDNTLFARFSFGGVFCAVRPLPYYEPPPFALVNPHTVALFDV